MQTEPRTGAKNHGPYGHLHQWPSEMPPEDEPGHLGTTLVALGGTGLITVLTPLPLEGPPSSGSVLTLTQIWRGGGTNTWPALRLCLTIPVRRMPARVMRRLSESILRGSSSGCLALRDNTYPDTPEYSGASPLVLPESGPDMLVYLVNSSRHTSWSPDRGENPVPLFSLSER